MLQLVRAGRVLVAIAFFLTPTLTAQTIVRPPVVVAPMPRPLEPAVRPVEPIRPMPQPAMQAVVAQRPIPAVEIVRINVVRTAERTDFVAELRQTTIREATPRRLIDKVATLSPVVYVDTTELTLRDRLKFESSARIAQAAVRPVHDLGQLLDSGVLRQSMTHWPMQQDHGGNYFQVAQLEVGGTTFHLTAWSRFADAVRAFMARLQSYFTGERTSSESTMSVMNEIRAEIAREMGISQKELVLQLQKEYGRAQFVELRIGVDWYGP